ncbi:hypothetical protein OIU34_20785 [Pararhizobium sp. BT-229]|uniref:hypothetical protein n=1 Tax=Pararhizobium sp. BT-229 TaxID=2986923 RepID=UPI0021F74980|nr:hypothetical protein [Pararhizobium sp. BT-229]MCV9964327.1 hypothetical protein [Pararhizobium sp. BT-229]
MLSPTELQEARRKAADRYFEIGMAHLPEGWTHEFRKSLTGMCHGKRKHVCGPRPVTRKSLYIWLHECAHAHLHFGKGGKRKPRHVEEMEAEQWAHARMRKHGIAVPRSMTTRAQAYVGRKIKQAEARGAKKIDPAAKRFAREKK